MSRARLKALATIRRLADRRLEEDASGLTALRSQIARLQVTKSQLRHKAAHQGQVATVESAPYVARFLRSIRVEELRLDDEIARLTKAAAHHEAVVRESYRAARVMKSAEDASRASQAADADRKEQQSLDELTITRFGRPK